MILDVHGGPWARDDWGFNPYHQWLANRGYAVLSVNYRGSTGFGKEFINAANGEWAAKMHDDLLDAVTWAVGKGSHRKTPWRSWVAATAATRRLSVDLHARRLRLRCRHSRTVEAWSRFLKTSRRTGCR